MRPFPAIRCLAVAFLFSLCLAATPPDAVCEARLKVTVSIDPQKYFVEKIGGRAVDVSVMLPKGASPATFEPSPGNMRQLSGSTLYFAVGVPFERAWLKKFHEAAPHMTLVRTDDGIEKMPMDSHHGDAGAPDPHVWLSPPLVMVQARNMLHALLAADPSNRASYQANYGRFIAEVVELDLEILDRFAAKPGNGRFMVYHPSWGYFAKAYGLEQIPVEHEGKEPTAKELARLIGLAKDLQVKVIFAQAQFSSKSARLIADAVGGRVVIADPLAQDWAANLREVSRQFLDAMR
jgi:zinc transport system substrate-binding protein